MRSFLVLCALALCSCQAASNGDTFEGANDFRIVPIPESWRAPARTSDGSTPQTMPNDGAIALRGYDRFQLHPTKQEMDSHPDEFFKSGDNIQITLKAGYIRYFTEGIAKHLMNDFNNAILGTDTPLKGEIAIVANVTEKSTTPGGRGEDGKLMGRVVFYSEDVQMSQLLNEFNVPLYGPRKYEGGELTIELWVLELDQAENQQFGSVLKSLADASSDIGGLPVPGLDILSRVGSAFLNSNEDDVIGHIKITLMPPSAGTFQTAPILRTSDIIITRTGDRAAGNKFDQCVYRPFRGVIFCNPASPPEHGTVDWAPTPDNMLVLMVTKPVSSVDIGPTIEWKDFAARVQTAPAPTAVNAVIEEFADMSAREAQRSASFSAADSVISPLTSLLVRERDADFLLLRFQCALLADRNLEAAKLDLVCGKSASNRQLSLEDVDNLIRRLQQKTEIDCAGLTRASLLPAAVDAISLAALRQPLIAKLTPSNPKSCPS